MTPLRVRRTLSILAILSLLLPIVLAVMHLAPPAAVLIGLLLAYGFSRGHAMLGREKALEQFYGAENRNPNASRTIYVQLVDERGVLLPREECERRLAEARQNAGPRDIVVPVTRRTQAR